MSKPVEEIAEGFKTLPAATGYCSHDRTAILTRLEILSKAHNALIANDWTLACLVLELSREHQFVDGKTVLETYEARLRRYFFELLEEDRYYEASALAWHREVFDQRPWHVQRIFNALRDFDLLIFMGGSKLSKTYGVAAWHALDWIRDSKDTSLRYSTMEETNLRANLWANLKYLITTCPFSPTLGRSSDASMTLNVPGQRPECGLEAILLPKSTISSSKLKGCHPKNFRPESHKLWGRSTRVRLILDEAQALLPGVEKDFGSPKTSVNSTTRVMKISLTLNPENETQWAVKLAAPVDGFTEAGMDILYDYTAPSGWRVCRLDARCHENVVERREIYPNQVTYESVIMRLRGGTEATAEWYTFCAGWPPPSGAADYCVPSAWFDGAIGEPIFTGRVVKAAGADIACLIDKAYLAILRHGYATGWLDADGKEHVFENRRTPGEIEVRTAVVLDQLIELKAREPLGLAEEIKETCTRLDISPEFVAGDETGVGFGTISALKRIWKAGEVTGVNFKGAPTVKRILAEDKASADGQVKDIVSEMYWTIRAWISPQVRGFFISPNCAHKATLKYQLTTRAYKYAIRNLIEVESKEKWMARNAAMSPDEADALVQGTLIVRLRGLQLPALQDEAANKPKDKPPADTRSHTSDTTRALRKPGDPAKSGRPRLGTPVTSLSQRLRQSPGRN